MAFVSKNPVSLAPNEEGLIKKRQLASALSKLTWFMRPEDWTIFDKFVGVSVLRKTSVASEQMRAYYQALSVSWAETSSVLCQASQDHGLNPLIGYRIADKFLFCHGVGMFDPDTGKLNAKSTTSMKASHPALLSLEKSLLASGQVLSQHMQQRLQAIATDVAPFLIKSGWTTL